MNAPDLRAPGLDLLRALAVLAVLFAHGGWFLFAAWPAYDAYAFAGWIGTEMFFALSGFLVTRQLLALPRAEPRASGRYLAWRLWRILPLFWLFLALNLLLATVAGRGVPESPWLFAPLAQNVLVSHPAFFGEAWNLPLLVAFTVAAPGIVLAADASSRRERSLALLLGMMLMLGIALRAASVIEYDPLWDAGVRKLLATRVDACLYGALAALVPLARVARTRSAIALLAVVSLAAAGAGFFWIARDASDFARIGLFVLSGIGCAALCLACAQSARSGAGRIAPWLARISWPAYLVNMPLLLVLDAAGFGQAESAGVATLRFASWFVLSLAAAAAVHWLLERPWLRLRARVFGADRAVPASCR